LDGNISLEVTEESSLVSWHWDTETGILEGNAKDRPNYDMT